ncbi:MAG: glycosyltransferase [Methylobacter sp.]
MNIHSVAPLDPVDAWLCASPEDAGKIHAEWGNHLSNGFSWYHPYRVRRKPIASVLSRKELALPEAALVLISVGYRLDIEIDGAWAVRMIDLLKDNPQVIWLLAGGKGTMPPALKQVPAQQVRALYELDDIPAVLQCCDIYVNPPRMGGGFSVAEAMAEGLPVVTYGDSDGGCKVGSSAAISDVDYFSKLAALLVSTDLRRQEGAAMQTLFSTTLDLDQSSPSLLAACDLALQRFTQRTTPVFS